MSAQTAINLNGVVFAPGGSQNGIAKWTNRSGGFGASFANITEKLATPAKSPVTRIEFDMDLPIVATEDDACACAGTLLRTSTVKISVWVPNSSTAAERVDLWTRIRDLVGNAAFVAAVENLDPAY